MTNEELVANLEENLTDVKRAETASGNVENYSLRDQIAAAEWLERKKAVQSAGQTNGRRVLFGGLGRISKLG